MKTRTFTLASILRTIMFAFIATTIFSSCSEEEFNAHSPDLLIGSWLYEKIDNVGRFVSSEEYDFYSNGKGSYFNSYNTKGYFDYEVVKNSIVFKMMYSIDNGKYFENSNFSHYFILQSRDTLIMNNIRYIRQKKY